MPIDAIGTRGVAQLLPNEQGAGLAIPSASAGAEGGKSFSDFLSGAIGDVNAMQQNASQMVQRYATGERMDVHQVMIAMEQASTALSLTTQVRNKIVEAYQEIMRTSV